MKLAGINILLFLFLGFSNCTAQQSMMEEVSEPYLAKLIQTAKNNYPRHKIFAKQVKIEQNNLNKIRLSWLDGLGIYYLYNPPSVASVNPTNRNGFQLGFSFNVGSLLEKPAQINAAKGDVVVARLQKDEYDLTIEADVKERYYTYIKQVTLLKQRTLLVSDAQTMLNSVRSKFEKGQDTFENLTNSLIFYNQQNQEKINTETELLITKAHLEELLNQKLEDIK